MAKGMFPHLSRILDVHSAHVLEKIFEPFFTTKSRGVGTGFGLSMIRHFVDQAHGHIEVHSTPQQGICIKLFLPVAAESQMKAA